MNEKYGRTFILFGSQLIVRETYSRDFLLPRRHPMKIPHGMTRRPVAVAFVISITHASQKNFWSYLQLHLITRAES